MSELSFLPTWPPDTAGLPWFALILLVAVLLGEAVNRWLRLPRALGWVACGLAAGPSLLGLVDAIAFEESRFLLQIAAGLVLFELGQRVDTGWLRRNPWLLASSVLEAGFSFAAVYAVLWLLQVPPLVAATAAAIALASSPSVVLALTRELRAQGQVTERILLFTALNCIYAFVVVSMLVAWLNAEYRGGWISVAAHPLWLIFGSLIVAFAFAAFTLWLLRMLGPRPDAQYMCVVALVVAAVAAAQSLRLSVPLLLLAYGTLARALDRDRRFVSLQFGRLGSIALVLLFALSAAGIDLRYVPAGLLAGVGLLAARWAGKTLGMFAVGRASGLSLRKASLVSLGLMPMSGLALLLTYDTAARYPELGVQLTTIMVCAIALLELIGPLTTQFALVRAGEASQASVQS